jgi:hypothetical protein
MEKSSCKLRLEVDPIRGWRLIGVGDCSSVKKVLQKIPERKRRYIERRLEFIESDEE